MPHVRLAACASLAALALAALALAALALAAAPALAQQKGDEYEITVKMEMAGMPAGMGTHTVRVCQDRHARDESYVPRGSGDCKVTDAKRTGNTLRYHMECSGRTAMVADGEMTWAGEGYSGKMHMRGKGGGDDGFDMTQTFAARKVGECANPGQAR